MIGLHALKIKNKSKLRHLRSWNTKISTHKEWVIKKFKIMMFTSKIGIFKTLFKKRCF